MDLGNFSAIQDIVEQYGDERDSRIRTYWDYYLGNHLLYYERWEDETETHYNSRAKYVIPICQKIVTTGVRWLYGKQQPKRRCNDEALDMIYQDEILSNNSIYRASRNIAVIGGVTGNAYVTLGWRNGRIMWGLEDTENVYMIPDPAMPTRPYAVIIRTLESYSSTDRIADEYLEKSGVITNEKDTNLVRTEVITPPQLDDNGIILENGIWHVYVGEERQEDEEFEGGLNPYPFLPVVNFINHEIPNTLDGLSDLHRIVDMNQDYNERVSDEAEVHKYHSFPTIVIKNSAKPGRLQRTPNRVWFLRSEEEADILGGSADTSNLQKHYERIRKEIELISDIPAIAMGESENVGNVAYLTLRLLFAPIIDKTLEKQLIYGGAERELAQKSLVMQMYHTTGGFIDMPEMEIDFLHPEETLPRDEGEELDNARRRIDMGFSTLRRELKRMYRDYSEEQIDELTTEIEEAKESIAGEEAFGKEVEAFVKKVVSGESRTQEE